MQQHTMQVGFQKIGQTKVGVSKVRRRCGAQRHVLRHTDAPLINSHPCRLLLLGASQTVLPARACYGGPEA